MAKMTTDREALVEFDATPDATGLGRVIVDGKYYGLPVDVVRKFAAAAGPACSAPDEALIEEIAKEAVHRRYLMNADRSLLHTAKWAIREYIRLSAGKEKT